MGHYRDLSTIASLAFLCVLFGTCIKVVVDAKKKAKTKSRPIAPKLTLKEWVEGISLMILFGGLNLAGLAFLVFVWAGIIGLLLIGIRAL